MVIQFPDAERLQGRGWFALRTPRYITLAHSLVWHRFNVNEADKLAGGPEFYDQFFAAWTASRDATNCHQSTPLRITLTNNPIRFVKCEGVNQPWESLRRQQPMKAAAFVR